MLNSKKAYNYFHSKFDLTKSTNGWWSFDCPICIKRKANKMAVNFDFEHVKCFLCGYRETIVDFVMMVEDCKYWDAKDIINSYDEADVEFGGIVTSFDTEQPLIEMPCGYMPIMMGDGILGQRARNYMTGRGFDLELMDRLGFGYCNQDHENFMENYYGYIIIPFRRDGKTVYFIGRDYLERGEKWRYKNPKTEKFGIGKADLIFNQDAVDLCETVTVSEGWADAMTMGRMGTATQGWSLSQTQKGIYKKGSCKNMVFIPDAGVDGKEERFYINAVKAALDFIEVKEKIYVLDMDLIVDKGKDVNELGKQAVLDLYKETEQLTYSRAIQILSNG